MSKSIRLSKKYGVNPTISVCFFCGEDKNEIALMGKMGGRGEDIEAPHRMVLDYEPCDCCKEKMSGGITMIGVVTDSPDGRPPITKQNGVELYPSGKWVVVSEDFIRRSLTDSDLAEAIIKVGRTVADDVVVEDLIAQIEELKGE